MNHLYYLCTKSSPDCQIWNTYYLIKDLKYSVIEYFIKKRKHILIDKCYKCESRMLVDLKEPNPNNSTLVLFAQTHMDLPIIIFQKECLYDIKADWFDTQPLYTRGVFFVSNGKLLLTEHPDYSSKYISWVTYDGVYDFLDRLEISKKYAKIFYKDVLGVINSKSSLHDIYNVMYKAYENCIESIKKEPVKTAELNLTKYKLINNMQNLVLQNG